MPLSGAYIKNNLINIRLYIAPYPGFEGVTVGSFSRAHIRPYILWLSSLGISGDKINKVLKTIRTALSDAALNGVIPANPFNKNDKAYHKERERGILTPAETQALIASPVANIYHRLRCCWRSAAPCGAGGVCD
ncbi:hypothetical protein FACS189485_02070 [Spirochaetia bacterium]|nr:hypothetical protein FACS189485_02070 [Spirochaetia bacterium]